MKMVKLSEIPKAARDFTRTFENDKFRLVRSETQFEKFALAEVEELQELNNGDFGGEKGRRIAYWFSEIGYGVICTQANFKKFVKLCEGSNTSSSSGSKPPKKRGTKRPSNTTAAETKATSKKSSRKKKTVNNEPDIELDFSPDYSIEKNLAEFSQGFKVIAKHYGIKTDIKTLLSKAPESEVITDLFKVVAEYLD